MTHPFKHFAASHVAGVRLLWAVAAVVPVLGGCVTYVQPAGTPPPPPQANFAEEAQDSAPAVTAEIPPPPLPVYEQPLLPEPGYIWTPGYWNYGPAGYFWVPGTWIMPPRVGVLWTPGYWGFVGGVYLFHAGYWAPHVGFYGGVNYGHGYFGDGYHGGRWVNNSFAYNTSVTNVNTTIVHNTYNETVINNTTVNRVSYNGGAGGVHAVATPAENAAMHERHVPPTSVQAQHFQAASQDRALQASMNQGHPPVAATPHPGVFNAPGVVPAHPSGAPAYTGGPGASGSAGPHGYPEAPGASGPGGPHAYPAGSAPHAPTGTAGAAGAPAAHGAPHTNSPQVLNTAVPPTTGKGPAAAPAAPQGKPHKVANPDKPKQGSEPGNNEKHDQK